MADNKRTRFVEMEEERHETLEKLITMLDDAMAICEDGNGSYNTRQMAEHMISCGVTINDRKRRERKNR